MNDPLFHVVLIEPEIPPNTGNIGRLCAGTNCVLHLVEPLGFQVDDKNLQRAGMDYWQHLEWHSWPNFSALQSAHAQGRFFYFTTKTDRLYTSIAFQKGDFLVFGRETKGLPEPLLQANESSCVTIPMFNPKIRSLNLATSAGIALYEGIRQLGIGKTPK